MKKESILFEYIKRNKMDYIVTIIVLIVGISIRYIIYK